MLNILKDIYNYEDNKNNKGVYILENNKNNKKYIGATFSKFKYRKENHLSLLKNKKHYCKEIQRDYDVYGKNEFNFYIVFISDDLEEIKEKEVYFIKKYIDCVYNKDINSKNVGNKHKEETKIKISKSNKGKKITNHQREILLNCNKNRIFSEETREKISKHFQGSKSNLAKLKESEVEDIKRMIIDGVKVQEISSKFNVKDSCIDNIRYNYRWKHVNIDGWEEYQKKRKRKNK